MKQDIFTHTAQGIITMVNICDMFSIVEVQSNRIFPLQELETVQRMIFVNEHVRTLYHAYHIGGAVVGDDIRWCNIPVKVDNTLANNQVVMKTTVADGCGA